MKTKSMIFGVAAIASSMLMAADTPEVENVVMSQAQFGRMVTVTYTLKNAPAVVTFDVETNTLADASGEWVSIGGEAVCNAKGAVWRKVTETDADSEGKYTITWRPDLSWEGHKVSLTDGGARAVVTAWALDNTPDYMVVDLAAANTVRYYPAVDFLPGSEMGQEGAVTNNPSYKTSKLLMRKIMASGVEWTMGSAYGETQRTDAREAPHVVSLTNNYYIGVYEITQEQWANIAGRARAAYYVTDGAMRPMEKVTYNEIRLLVDAEGRQNTTSGMGATEEDIANYSWPKDPNPKSYLGLLRAKTGLDFDLPSEAQWEFAARAGYGSGFWGDGSVINNANSDDNLSKLSRYKANSPNGATETWNSYLLTPAEGGTDIVGSHKPNAWGLYDVYGNIYEWCLDWFVESISNNEGKININPNSPSSPLSSTSTKRVIRGGSWGHYASDCRPAFRNGLPPTDCHSILGFRVVCTAGLK